MYIKILEWVCPAVILCIIFTLKFAIDENVCIERFIRLFTEATVDITSLSTSFVVSFIIASISKIIFESTKKTVNNLITCIICLLVYIVLLIIVVICSKYGLRKYSETEKSRYLIISNIIGYPISVLCLFFSIKLLCGLGGL